ncbi:hypothetical protein Micbo1qcDRAFT_62482 [Microdochium bolleyi]|uniref:Uncharacterized protein n=1 Tax=Microdochium bolleyi TaxID=196109 RepID=A0A136J5M4_9PEZI|nr:hypothetical protein Micbo1qcDRAFT_62482 [Microdochium bolleyi]
MRKNMLRRPSESVCKQIYSERRLRARGPCILCNTHADLRALLALIQWRVLFHRKGLNQSCNVLASSPTWTSPIGSLKLPTSLRGQHTTGPRLYRHRSLSLHCFPALAVLAHVELVSTGLFVTQMREKVNWGCSMLTQPSVTPTPPGGNTIIMLTGVENPW